MAHRQSSPAATYAVLLRGVNVGGKRSLPMADVRSICSAAGCDAVRTYIQSGNVVLRSPLAEATLAAELEERFAAHAGFRVPVVVRDVEGLASAVDRCPFGATVDPATLVVSFVQSRPAGDPLRGLDPHGFGDEQLVLDGRELYLRLPHGQGRSKLAQAVARTPFGEVATARNWRTVLRLLELARQARSEHP